MIYISKHGYVFPKMPTRGSFTTPHAYFRSERLARMFLKGIKKRGKGISRIPGKGWIVWWDYVPPPINREVVL